MGKEKIEEKDVRLLRYAVEQAFDGAMRDGALTLLNRLVDSASEAENLEEELLNLKGEYQRSMEQSKRGAFKRLHAAYKRKCRREKRVAEGQMLCADGKPVMFGDNHGEGTGELTAAALHTVLDGKAKVHKAEDDEDAAEGGHTIREKVFHVFQHG